MISMKRGTETKRPAALPGRLRAVPHEKKGLRPALYRLRPDQIAALRREALRRAVERDSGKPDASEVLRELLDAWLAKSEGRRRGG